MLARPDDPPAAGGFDDQLVGANLRNLVEPARPKDRLRVVHHHATAFVIERGAEHEGASGAEDQPPDADGRRRERFAVSARHADAGERMDEPPALASRRLAERLALPRV